MLKRGKNCVLRSVGSYGTWHESSIKKIYDSGSWSGRTSIGFNKLLRGGQDPNDDQDLFDKNPRLAAIDGHSQFQVLDSQEYGLTKNMGSEVEGLDQEKKGMECLPLSLSLVDFVDAHHLFDENPSPAALGDQEEIAEKMAYEVVDGIDEAEIEGPLLNLADDTEPYFDPLCFLDLLLDLLPQAQKRKLGLLEDDDSSKLATPASPGELNVKDISTGVRKNQDNSDRAFYKELVKVIEASYVILEVLDARDPLSTRFVDMENLVMKAGPDKHLVLLLNKIGNLLLSLPLSLLIMHKWLKYLREELPAVAFKCSTQEQRSNLGWKSSSKAAKPSNLLQTSDRLGAETLIKLLKNYSRSHDLVLIGLPNVGKSSLNNSLKRSHVVNVGSTPGLTRSMQEVQLDKNVKLLDCPGVVMLRSGANDASITLRNCKRIEKLDDPIGPVKEILRRCPPSMLVTLYKLPSFDLVDDFLQKVATIKGKLKKDGVVDVEAAARIVQHDWNQGMC
ncbi:hypothetical protein SO802_031989 [Lithocarpus litseifolius]|uniref:CP-type G domain-containing protein n=1 Tax=Lithocarpus litseifolius TaxID=425828 RepID=A0AAW2BN20_9ROSI